MLMLCRRAFTKKSLSRTVKRQAIAQKTEHYYQQYINIPVN